MKARRLPVVRLLPGRDKSLRQRHPWIFSGAIGKVDGSPQAGDTVEIRTDDGRFLAIAAWSPRSQIRARVWSFDDVTVDAAFVDAAIERAVRARDPLLDPRHSGCRLVHGESDGVPGVIADRYGEVVVLALLSAGAEAWRDTIVAALFTHASATCIVERSDADVRALEGLEPRVGVLHGDLPANLCIVEAGLRYRIDVMHGQKTGFYLDQRDNRALVGTLARERDVLNAFCYTGGFSVAALAGGARSVVSIDSSAEALGLARENVALNTFGNAGRASFDEADVFAYLRALRNRGEAFDLIILDPPKFAPTARHAAKAARAYKDINLWGLKLLRPGGHLATFSCSGGMPADLFQKIVAGAALDAGVNALIERRLGPSADHPVALAFPEGDYLKGLLVRRA